MACRAILFPQHWAISGPCNSAITRASSPADEQKKHGKNGRVVQDGMQFQARVDSLSQAGLVQARLEVHGRHSRLQSGSPVAPKNLSSFNFGEFKKLQQKYNLFV